MRACGAAPCRNFPRWAGSMGSELPIDPAVMRADPRVAMGYTNTFASYSFSLSLARAAARRAMGTRGAEHET